MTVWTNRALVAQSLSNPSVYTDGLYIYLFSVGYEAKAYNTVSDSVADITDGSSFAGFYPVNMVYFDGGLYAVVSGNLVGNSYDIQVWKYSGSGTSWSKVLDSVAAKSLVGDPDNLFLCNDDYIVLMYYSDISYTIATLYTANGTTWGAGSISGVATPLLSNKPDFMQLGGLCGLYCTLSSSGDMYIMKFDAGVWSVAEATGTTTEIFVADSPSRVWKFIGATSQYRYSESCSFSWVAATDPTIAPSLVDSLGLLATDVGCNVSGSDLLIYYWDSGDWLLSETIDLTPEVPSPYLIPLALYAAMDDGYVWAVVHDDHTPAQFQIWSSDLEPPPPAPPAPALIHVILHRGVGAFETEAYLPYDYANPQAIAVRDDIAYLASSYIFSSYPASYDFPVIRVSSPFTSYDLFSSGLSGGPFDLRAIGVV